MKKLIIDEKHENDINVALKEGQGRATARIVENCSELMDIIEQAVFKLNVPKKALAGCKLHLRIGAGHYRGFFSNYTQGTYITVNFRKDGKGELKEVYRSYVHDKKKEQWEITPTCRDYIVKGLNCHVI